MDISKKNDLIEKLAKIEEGKVQKRFALENDGNFKHNIERLFNGSGDESSKFYAVDSSSRLSFLCFSSWIEKNGYVEIEIKGKGPVKFTQLYFEAKNKVLNNPSNVDVLLANEEKKILIYLESKFTEYVRDAKDSAKLGKSYSTTNDLGIRNVIDHLAFVDSKEDDGSRKIKADTYSGGIKQMICHFIGVCKGPSLSDKDIKTISGLWEGAKHIYLGSILYQFSDDEFEQCRTEHIKLANDLNKLSFGTKKNEIKVIGKPFTYQELAKKNPLPKEVADYYRL